MGVAVELEEEPGPLPSPEPGLACGSHETDPDALEQEVEGSRYHHRWDFHPSS